MGHPLKMCLPNSLQNVTVLLGGLKLTFSEKIKPSILSHKEEVNMAKSDNYSRLCWLTAFSLLMAFSGCALVRTKPNPVYEGPYPEKFSELAQKNPLLAKELGKLPELQNGISEGEATTIKKMVSLYNESPDVFDKAFRKMYTVGKPEVRKYCSPLQALYWLVEDNTLTLKNNPLTDYSLKKLIAMAWQFEKSIPVLSEKQILEVITGIKDEELKNRLLQYIKGVNGVELTLHTLYVTWQYYPDIFSPKSLGILVNSTNQDSRWTDFEIVVDRLNSPDLLHYYIKKNITYRKNRTNSHTPKHTFSHNWGDCDDLAVFGDYILRKGGYKSYMRYVHWTPDNRGHVGVVIKLEDGRYFLVVDFTSWGNKMAGPYTNISEVDEKLSGGHNYHDSGWWAPGR